MAEVPRAPRPLSARRMGDAPFLGQDHVVEGRKVEDGDWGILPPGGHLPPPTAIPKQVFCTARHTAILHVPGGYVSRVWRAHRASNPEYTWRLFNEAQCAAYMAEHFPGHVNTCYCQLIPGAYRADLWRLCVLYREGGVYLDLGLRLLVPLSQFVPEGTDLLVCRDVSEGALWNAVMAAPPRHPFIEAAIKELCRNVANFRYGVNPLDITGPMAVGRAFMKVMGTGDVVSVPDRGCMCLMNRKSFITPMGPGGPHDASTVDTHWIHGKLDAVPRVKYRADMALFGAPNEVTKHYSELWRSRQVFHCMVHGSWNHHAKEARIEGEYLVVKWSRGRGMPVEPQTIRLAPGIPVEVDKLGHLVYGNPSKRPGSVPGDWVDAARNVRYDPDTGLTHMELERWGKDAGTWVTVGARLHPFIAYAHEDGALVPLVWGGEEEEKA